MSNNFFIDNFNNIPELTPNGKLPFSNIDWINFKTTEAYLQNPKLYNYNGVMDCYIPASTVVCDYTSAKREEKKTKSITYKYILEYEFEDDEPFQMVIRKKEME